MSECIINANESNVVMMLDFIRVLAKEEDEEEYQPDNRQETKDWLVPLQVLSAFWNTPPLQRLLADVEKEGSVWKWKNYLRTLADAYVKAHDPDCLSELLNSRFSYLTPLEKLIVSRHLGL